VSSIISKATAASNKARRSFTRVVQGILRNHLIPYDTFISKKFVVSAYFVNFFQSRYAQQFYREPCAFRKPTSFQQRPIDARLYAADYKDQECENVYRSIWGNDVRYWWFSWWWFGLAVGGAIVSVGAFRWADRGQWVQACVLIVAGGMLSQVSIIKLAGDWGCWALRG
jgi:hypothetical protein